MVLPSRVWAMVAMRASRCLAVVAVVIVAGGDSVLLSWWDAACVSCAARWDKRRVFTSDRRFWTSRWSASAISLVVQQISSRV